MARPRTFDEGQVLDAIEQLFSSKGYGDTSIADLEQASGLKRTSLYAAYGDKANLYMTVLKRYQMRSAALMSKYLSSTNPPMSNLTDLVTDSVLHAAGEAERRGCLINNCAVDRSGKCEATTDFLKQNRTMVTDLFASHLQQDPRFADRNEAIRTAEYIFTLYSGLMLSVKQGVEVDTLKGIIDSGFAQL